MTRREYADRLGRYMDMMNVAIPEPRIVRIGPKAETAKTTLLKAFDDLVGAQLAHCEYVVIKIRTTTRGGEKETFFNLTEELEAVAGSYAMGQLMAQMQGTLAANGSNSQEEKKEIDKCKEFITNALLKKELVFIDFCHSAWVDAGVRNEEEEK